MNRRSFLGTLAVGFAAPAVVRVSSLMKIVVPSVEEVLQINAQMSFGSTDFRGIFGKSLWPGIEQYWYKQYALGYQVHYDELQDSIYKVKHG